MADDTKVEIERAELERLQAVEASVADMQAALTQATQALANQPLKGEPVPVEAVVYSEKDFVNVLDADGKDLGSVPRKWVGTGLLPAGAKVGKPKA